MAERQTISQKITELFAYRRIPELLRMAGIESDSPFVTRLYRLQEVIYGLDHYLESHWKVRKKELKDIWEQIYEALWAFGIEKKEARKYVKDIRSYEQYELDLRKKKLPLEKSIKSLYAWKSCDVKLMRRLIYRHAPGLEAQLAEKDWVCYDLITEVNDDVHDVYEDCETINGNRFMLSLLVRGKRKTRKAYRNFLEQTGEQARKHFKKKKRDLERSLYGWTRERQKETEELLRETMDDQKLSLVEKSRIAVKVLGVKQKPMQQ